MAQNFVFDYYNIEEKKRRKEMYKYIGEDVFSFFQDIAIQEGYENREGQWDMSCDITDAMREKQHILVEAGVGIGKSFAYIVPLLYYHKRYKRPIVIATSTIALQEQLKSDIKVIEDLIKYHTSVIIYKGQNHFLCRKRFDEYSASDVEEEIYKEIKKGGCEKTDWNFIIPDKMWNQINVKEFNPVYCRQKCIYSKSCFYYQLRQRLLITEGIILCNQDLLTINLQKRNSNSKEIITNKFEFVVIDEVHNLENKVRNAYTVEINYLSLKKTIQQARKIVRGIGSTIDNKISDYYKCLEVLFSELEKQIFYQDKEAEQNNREIERYSVNRNIPILKRLKDCVHDIFLEASMQFGAVNSYKNRDYDFELEALEQQEDFFISMLDQNSNDVFWMNSKKIGKKGICLSKCPKDVNKLIESLFFYDNQFTTILTSATITSGNSNNYLDGYRYFISNTNFPIKKSLISEPKYSPFNYDDHSMIYYTEHMPHPSHERKKFIEIGTEEIIKLINISQGKTLVLFTAKSDMLEVYEILKERIPYKILLQNRGASQREIISDFKQNVNSVLLGTGTYWEGISVKGKALSNLIIFKLPFPVPDPIIEYKQSICENGLMEVLVPEMIIRLKQGIGRLIRSEKDFGIVSIIDSRVGEKSKAPYKQMIWNALPIKNRTGKIQEIKEFYNSLLERNKETCDSKEC